MFDEYGVRRCFMVEDTGVVPQGNSLSGKSVLLGITGGIAATEAVRLSRELRRHGAEITVIMTTAATKVITPLAIQWATQGPVITDWDSEMSQLKGFDAVLIAPATRNFLARYSCGMMDHPLLMACSAARGRSSPIIVVPSMHADLFDDPVTNDILSRITETEIILGPYEEGRFKQPSPVQIVAELCHVVNSSEDSKDVVVTLGATKTPIDSVRVVQNTSTGATGWRISEYLYRHGFNVTVVAGETKAEPTFTLPNVIQRSHPDDMLAACVELAKNSAPPDCWIYTAAILDYCTTPLSGKKSSSSGKSWDIELFAGKKHIEELAKFNAGAIRIGFKLESIEGHEYSESSALENLHSKAIEQIEKYGVDATIGNILEHLADPNLPRGYLITNSDMITLEDIAQMCQEITRILAP